MQHVTEPRTLPRHEWVRQMSKWHVEHTVSLLSADDLRPPIVSAAATTPPKVQTIDVDKRNEVEEHPSHGRHWRQRTPGDRDLLDAFSETSRRMRWKTERDEAYRPVREQVAEKHVHIENSASLGPSCRSAEERGSPPGPLHPTSLAAVQHCGTRGLEPLPKPRSDDFVSLAFERFEVLRGNLQYIAKR